MEEVRELWAVAEKGTGTRLEAEKETEHSGQVVAVAFEPEPQE